MTADAGPVTTHVLAAVFFLIGVTFLRRSFYNMRIKSGT